MARILLIGILVAIIVWVVSVVDCAVQPPTRHRGVSKPTWVVIVVFLPVIGGILWFWLGRTRAAQLRQSAPDDDVAFLSSLKGSRVSAAEQSAEQDERIRQLEEELAKLDDEEPHRHPSDDGEDTHGARS